MNEQEREEVTSAAEWDQYEANEAGFARPECCWILSGRDVWYRNPYYVGPVQPHPEDNE